MTTPHYRYSPSLWPGDQTLPVPTLRRFDALELTDDGWITPVDYINSVPALVEPPPEMHLREFRDCDIRSPESLRDLLLAVGQIDSRAGGHPEHVSMQDWNYRRSIQGIAEQLGFPVPDFAVRPDWSDAIHVAEVAFCVDIVRALGEHVDLALSMEATSPVWQRRGLLEESEAMKLIHRVGPDRTAFEDELPETIAWKCFSDFINPGLAELSPRVVPPHLDSEPDFEHVKDAWVASCVLLFNDLAEGIPYKRCADETCGRVFRFQLGRATRHDRAGRSHGVVYCSPGHARNQSQRERRRAARAAVQRESE